MMRRSRKAKAVPEYAAASSQLKSDLASVVSMCRTTSRSNSSLDLNSDADYIPTSAYSTLNRLVLVRRGSRKTDVFPPGLSLWLRNARLYALDFLGAKSSYCTLVLWPGDSSWPNGSLEVSDGRISTWPPLARRWSLVCRCHVYWHELSRCEKCMITTVSRKGPGSATFGMLKTGVVQMGLRRMMGVEVGVLLGRSGSGAGGSGRRCVYDELNASVRACHCTCIVVERAPRRGAAG